MFVTINKYIMCLSVIFIFIQIIYNLAYLLLFFNYEYYYFLISPPHNSNNERHSRICNLKKVGRVFWYFRNDIRPLWYLLLKWRNQAAKSKLAFNFAFAFLF